MAGGPGASVLAPPGSRLTSTIAQSRPFLIPADGQFNYRLAGVPVRPRLRAAFNPEFRLAGSRIGRLRWRLSHADGRSWV